LPVGAHFDIRVLASVSRYLDRGAFFLGWTWLDNRAP